MQIPRPPRAVTFDCWSTLINDIDWDVTVQRRVEALVEFAAAHGAELDLERGTELIEGSWREHVDAWRRGELYGNRGAARWCLDQLGLGPNEGLSDELANAIGASTEGNTHVVDGAVEVLEAVKVAGIATALICDTGFTPSSQVRRYLAAHGIALDHYLFSDEVGSPKPFRPIFEAALRATGADPSAAVHIGDLRRTDIAGAHDAGMAAIRFAGIHDDRWEEDSRGPEADAVIERWAELPRILGI